MASSMLFDPCTFTMEVPLEFKSYPKESIVHLSVFNVGSVKKATLHAPTLRAILAYMRLSKATTDGASVEVCPPRKNRQ